MDVCVGNTTKNAATLLVIVFIVPDTGEERAGISVSLSHYTTGQLPCRESKEKFVIAELINSSSPGQEKNNLKKGQDIFMGQKENWAFMGLPVFHCC